MGVGFRPLALQVPLFPTHLYKERKGSMGKIGSPGEVSLRPESQRDPALVPSSDPNTQIHPGAHASLAVLSVPLRLDKSTL